MPIVTCFFDVFSAALGYTCIIRALHEIGLYNKRIVGGRMLRYIGVCMFSCTYVRTAYLFFCMFHLSNHLTDYNEIWF
jgi:hypothetical protein